MVKSGIMVVLLGGLGLFGYFYATSSDQTSKGARAKQAVRDVGDAVRDKGVAEMVELRLKAKFGLDATRFVHAYFDDGRVVVYGLAPAAVDSAMLSAEAAKVPGVKAVETLVQARPDYIAPLKSLKSAKQPRGDSPPPKGSGD